MSAPIRCADCGADVDPLELFPRNRCLACHAAAPEVRRMHAAMTGEKLAAMWGGGRHVGD
jgi:hypothetical protein